MTLTLTLCSPREPIGSQNRYPLSAFLVKRESTLFFAISETRDQELFRTPKNNLELLLSFENEAIKVNHLGGNFVEMCPNQLEGTKSQQREPFSQF